MNGPNEKDFEGLIGGMRSRLEALERRQLRAFETFPSAAERDIVYPEPVPGQTIFRSDTGWFEQFFPTYNSANTPGGATPGGWRPVTGALPMFAGSSLGTVSAASGPWVDLTTTNGVGTRTRNDGFGPGSTLTVPFPGVYSVSARATFAGNSTGATRGIRIYSDVNSSDFQHVPRGTGITASGYLLVISAVLQVNSLLRVAVLHDVGSAINVQLDTLDVAYMGPARY